VSNRSGHRNPSPPEGGIKGADQGFLAALDLPIPETTRKGDMLYRPLGRTGEIVSILGLGGSHLGRMDSAEESIRLIRKSIDQGLTFLDNSWDYHGGESERRMGQALKGGYRDRVFLMTKFDGRNRETAGKQIDESLSRLGTDRIDLIQFHEVIRLEDPDLFFGEEGAFEAVLRAKEAGKVRYFGFTGHKDPLVHQRMLSVAAEQGVRFDSVQLPLNILDAHFRSFQNHVLPALVQEGIAVLGMKSMGNGDILESGVVKPVECLHYAMSLPTSVVITGIESMELLDQALEAVRDFAPLRREQINDLLERTREPAQRGRFERFKTSTVYDSTARHPEWLL
jgi:predicted aldo/keto reductase-like oxidoreductase